MKKKYSKRYQIIIRAEILTVPEIAKELKVSRSYVYRVLRETHKFCEERQENFHKLPVLTVANYIALHNEFGTEEELAKHFGVSRSTLHRFKVNHNIPKLMRQYHALFSRDASIPTSLYNILDNLIYVEGILSICEPDAIELPAIKLLIDTIRNSPFFVG